MKKIILISVASLLTLSSCGVYSKYERASSIDSSLYGDAVATIEQQEGSSRLGEISWREIFSDIELQKLIEIGLKNNANLKTAELRIEEANNSLVAARLAYLPSLSLSAQGTTAGLVEGGASYNTYTIPLATAWEVDIFGRITNQKLKAKMALEQQTYSAQAIRTELVAGIANLYYTISMLEHQLEIATATQKSWDESYRTAQAMMKAGMMNQAGLSQIEASQYSVAMSVTNLQKDLKKSQNALCSLIAIAPTSIKGGSLDNVLLPEKLNAGVPMQMLSSRPDVMAVEAALAGSFYSENIARSALYPSISLSGTLGWTNYSGGVIVNPAVMIYNVVGQVVQPIFNRGLNRAQLKNATAELEVARIAFEQKILDAGIEVNDALITLSTAQNNAKMYADQEAALIVAANSTKLMMQHGSTTYLEVLTAQQTLFNAQLGVVANKFDQMQSAISLYKALGGGRF